jgi:hypothetical protein
MVLLVPVAPKLQHCQHHLQGLNTHSVLGARVAVPLEFLIQKIWTVRILISNKFLSDSWTAFEIP